MSGKVKLTQIRSIIGRPEKHRRILRALGLRKINMTVEHKNNPAILGMAKKVPHLVRVEEV
ncbi:LSU ribosomal protein L30P [Desulfocicer vacuolatum DSM 3385]|jgi:large subunit ribosomal protein L30|uniref:50S ribosomal protein L30 n=1 Tax=Desulfocicer vacuolatum DSM 3385 TaxID=1121400 RepID=A0A1W1YI47_9BACT|nr:50S ribosomal protein L30 [Desulfocicer vacuolatum]SMC35813.1 LSU ribosomal protein L30P [Desulfocicer vacuolatum DSM 3385]